MSSGHAEITVTRGHLTLDMEVQNDGSGRPEILVSEPPSVGFEGLDIRVSGSKLAALYNIIAQLAEVCAPLPPLSCSHGSSLLHLNSEA